MARNIWNIYQSYILLYLITNDFIGRNQTSMEIFSLNVILLFLQSHFSAFYISDKKTIWTHQHEEAYCCLIHQLHCVHPLLWRHEGWESRENISASFRRDKVFLLPQYFKIWQVIVLCNPGEGCPFYAAAFRPTVYTVFPLPIFPSFGYFVPFYFGLFALEGSTWTRIFLLSTFL